MSRCWKVHKQRLQVEKIASSFRPSNNEDICQNKEINEHITDIIQGKQATDIYDHIKRPKITSDGKEEGQDEVRMTKYCTHKVRIKKKYT